MKAQPTTKQLIEMLYERLPELFDRAAAQPAPVQEPFDHQHAASTALRESMNRSNAIAKNTVPTLQKRPQNCGTGYCSCVECVMEPAPLEPVAFEVGLVEWVGNKLMATPKTTTTAPASWVEMVTANLVREGVNKHKARELAEHFYGLAQRQWVGLTEDEIDEIFNNWPTYNLDHFEFGKVVEAKVFEKNGAIAVVIPDALNPKDENPAYVAGWNDCRAEMLRHN
jgi:hypothetical protein